jgi:hypothetical protein|uniref:Phytocyanin domain-containing protein n=1 Tax=Fagus sylvatica TaxID=28930 RepID=A0A2N9GJ75_FAGSY
MAMQIALLILTLAAPVVYGAQHIVGDSTGWSQGVDYSTWATGKTFTVGDTLLFTYTTTHKVDIVNQADYNNCNSGNAIQSYQDGNTTIPLSSAGTTYYICPTAGHCAGGMKLSVNVVAASTAPSGTPPTTPSTTVSPPPPPPSGAASISCNMNNLMFGFLLVLVTMFAYMG